MPILETGVRVRMIFWPDLASSHYLNATQEAYKTLGINFVPKEANPPNVPQIHSIERFWAYLRQKLYENGWTTEDTAVLTRRITTIIRKSPENLCQNLTRGLKRKVRKAADRGVLSVIN